MRIASYQFGRIEIGGTEYSSDVIVYADRVRDRWWRKEGHRLHPEDLDEILKDPPAVLVIGTGYYGNMKVPPETVAALRGNGIDVRVAPTAEAVEEFNRLQREAAAVVAALHLTC